MGWNAPQYLAPFPICEPCAKSPQLIDRVAGMSIGVTTGATQNLLGFFCKSSALTGVDRASEVDPRLLAV